MGALADSSASLGGIFILALAVAAWAADFLGLLSLPKHESATAFGTAEWADKAELRRIGLTGGQGLIVGRQGRRLLRLATDRHLLTLAPTRSGKGVSSIIPNLLTYPGSVFVVDVKGENAAITARRRRAMGQAVHVLDPWGISGVKSCAFNPLDLIDLRSPDVAEDAALLADALVIERGGGDSHWDDEARALLAGLILHVASIEPQATRTLAKVRELVALPPDQFGELLDDMSVNLSAHGLVARCAYRLRQKADRERSGVVSTAQAHTHFLDSPRMAQVMGGSDFNLADLKRKRVSVFVVLPAERISTFNRWLRLMVGEALTAMARTPGKPSRPVLFLLDEFAVLGRLASVETAMGLMAGYGAQLWPILQDLSQLKVLYGERWRTFVANAGLVQAFNVADPLTAEHLSSMLGRRTATVRSVSASSRAGRRDGAGSSSFSSVGRPLLLPDEIMRLPADKQILFVQGRKPVLATKPLYFADAEFRGLFDANPWRLGQAKGAKP